MTAASAGAAALRSRGSWTSRIASAIVMALLLVLLLKWMDWAVLKAVFRPDAQACHALAHTGACWGVIAEKFRPMLLGRYPFDEQWRPLLALAWTLFVLGVAYALGWRRLTTLLGGRLGGLVLAVWAAAGWMLMRGGVPGLTQVPVDLWGGLPLTILLAVCSWSLSLPLGMMLALGRRSSKSWLKWPCTTFIELVRGVPLVTLLFMAAFMLPALLPSDAQWSLLPRVLVALTMFSSAYMAEIVRAGLQTVPAEQIEAAQILGLSAWRTQRLIVLPQAMRAVLPALVGHAIGLLKDTSLVMVVSLHELTGALSLSLGGDPEWRPFYLEGYLFIAAVYAAMCLGLARLGRYMEKIWQSAVR